MPARYTIADLCRDLAEKTEREGTKWYLTSIGRLRTFADDLCPLGYITGERLRYESAILARGMGMLAARRIEDAADWTDTKDPEVRALLLAATGAA